MSDYIKELRRLIGSTKIIVPGVRALIFDEAGRLLLARQRLFGSWALPHGCIDLGESASAALAREVTEETGLRAIRAEPFGLYSDPKYSVTYPNGDEVQTLTMAFVVREWEGTYGQMVTRWSSSGSFRSRRSRTLSTPFTWKRSTTTAAPRVGSSSNSIGCRTRCR